MKRYSILKTITASAVITLLTVGTASAKKRDTGVDPEGKNKTASIAPAPSPSLICTLLNLNCPEVPEETEDSKKKDEKPKE